MSRLRRLRVAALATGDCELSEAEAHYASRVLRLRSGDQVEVFDGRGCIGTGVFAAGHVRVEDVESVPAPLIRLTIAVAPPKGERADWLVEKVGELGAAQLVWLKTERSVAEASRRIERHRRVAEAAARQSGRAFITEIEEPLSFERFLQRDFDHRILTHPGAECGLSIEPSSKEKSVAVLVGPEAGFTEAEVLSALTAGYAKMNIARSILRIETAAVVATAFALREVCAVDEAESEVR
ncbi:MAG: RsmE family RNA methyltransferase [Myxococcota bacterium]